MRRVDKLPPKSKQLIHFYYYDNFSLKEIASLLKMKVSAVSKAICRIRERLKGCILRHRTREVSHG